MNTEEFKKACEECKTQRELDEVLKKNVLVWYEKQELLPFVRGQRARLVKTSGF